MLIGLIGYTWYTVNRRRGSTWNKFGPLILVCCAFPLIIADPLRHVFQDANIWPSPGSNQYRAGCASETENENIKCLSIVGVFFTIIFTWSGFALLIVGTMWNANICAKIREIKEEWKELRSSDTLDDVENPTTH